MQTPKEMEKCSLVKYNPTGHLLALVGGGAWVGTSTSCNNNLIFIYATLSKRQLAVLKGHATQIIDLAWSADGLYLCSASECSVYTWHMETFTKHQESVNKAFFNSCIAVSQDFSTVVVGHSGQGLRILSTARPSKSPAGEVEEKVKLAPLMGSPRKSRVTSARRSIAAYARVPGSSHTATFIPVPEQGTTTQAPGREASSLEPSSLTRNLQPAASDATAGDLVLQHHFPAVTQPQHQGLSIAENMDFSAIISADLTVGHVRVCSIKPRGDDDFDEYAPHVSAITQVIVHPRGRLVFTCDSLGCWFMYALVPRDQIPRGHSIVDEAAESAAQKGPPKLHAAHASPFRSLLHRTHALIAKDMQARAKEEGENEVISVRASDVKLMKEQIREWKDRLGKAAAASEYKIYHREQEIRREMDAQISKLKADNLALATELGESKDLFQVTVNAHSEREKALREMHSERLQKEKDLFDQRLAQEIEKTGQYEKQIETIKAKFGQVVWNLDVDQKKKQIEKTEAVLKLESQIKSERRKAALNIREKQEQMELEINLDAGMNDEELSRATEGTKKILDKRNDKITELRTKLAIQMGINTKITEMNDILTTSNETITSENKRLSERILGLTEELQIMHEAWAERDAKKRTQDEEMKEMLQRIQQGQVYSEMAASRIKDLNDEMDPLKQSRSEARENLIELEAAQMRLVERRKKADREYVRLQGELDMVREELKEARLEVSKRESWIENFTTQLFRMVHSVDVSKWPIVFGKLHADYKMGKERADWSKYIPSDTAALAAPALKTAPYLGKEGDMSDKEERIRTERLLTSKEFESQIQQLQMAIKHSEKVIMTNKEASQKREEAQKCVIQRLVADSSVILNECNALKKTIKEQKEALDKQAAELFNLRNEASQNSGLGSGLSRSVSTAPALASRFSRSSTAPNGAPHAVLDSTLPSQNPELSSTEMLAAAAAKCSMNGDSRGPHACSGSDVRPSSVPSSAAHQPPPPPWGALVRSAASASARSSYSYADNNSGGIGIGGALDGKPGSGAPRKEAEEPGPSNKTVTGDMPVGGWWLGEDSPFAQPDGGLGIVRESDASSSKRLASYSALGSLVKNTRAGAADGQRGHRAAGGRAKTAAAGAAAKQAQQIPQTVLMPRSVQSASARRPIMYSTMASADTSQGKTWASHLQSAAADADQQQPSISQRQPYIEHHNGRSEPGELPTYNAVVDSSKNYSALHMLDSVTDNQLNITWGGKNAASAVSPGFRNNRPATTRR